VEQLAIEDVTGQSLAEAARLRVFDPLGMTRSSYEQPLPASFGNIARAHGPNGAPRTLPRGWETMPEGAAAGRWTTPSDLGTLIVALVESYHGSAGALLSQAIAQEMMTPVAPSPFGLGPDLVLSPNGILFRHGGVNDSYVSNLYGLVCMRAGVVVTTNSDNGGGLIDEIVRAVWDAEGWPTS
jgi:CubicO group peptidase (beta-lactamase class C family)